MGVLRGCELTLGYIAHSVYRIVQLALALAVCGLYGVDLHRANREHKYSDGKWVRSEPHFEGGASPSSYPTQLTS